MISKNHYYKGLNIYHFWHQLLHRRQHQLSYTNNNNNSVTNCCTLVNTAALLFDRRLSIGNA
jgi:hypothetical protein